MAPAVSAAGALREAEGGPRGCEGGASGWRRGRRAAFPVPLGLEF